MAQMAKYAPGRARRSGRRFRWTGLLGALLLALFALTGCVTVQLNATVHPDGTLSGTARYGVAKSMAALVGGEDQLRNQLKSQGSCDFGSRQGSTKDFDDGTYIGIECAFDKITMAEFNSGEEGPKLAKVGNEFHLTGSLNLLQAMSNNGNGLLGGSSPTAGAPAPTALPSLPSGLPSGLTSLLPSGLTSLLPSDLTSLLPSDLPSDLTSLLPSDLPSLLPSSVPNSGFPGLDPSSLLRTAKVSFAFTFPGKVIASKGKINGRKVTFTPDSSGVIDFQTTASATPYSSPLGTTSWLVLAVVVLALLAAAGLLLRRRRAAARAGLAGYPDGLGQAYPGQPWPGQQQYPTQHYPVEQYPTQQYPTQQYPPAPQPGYPSEPYSGPPPTQPYPSQQPYPTQPYPPAQPYPSQQPYPPTQPQPDQPNPWARPDDDPTRPWPDVQKPTN